jgi:drug/metabolite transporter (DMT)-like permease
VCLGYTRACGGQGLKHSPQHRLALVAALILILIWGANFSVQKYLLNTITPSGFLLARYLIMPVCGLVLMRVTMGQFLPPLPRKDVFELARLGFVGHSLHVGIVCYGIHLSTPFSSSVILACGPIFTLLILRWKGHEKLQRTQVLGVTVAFVGVMLFLSEKLLKGDLRATGGDVILFVAALLFSYYTVQAKPMLEKHGSVLTMGYATLWGGLPVMLLSIPSGMEAPWASLGWHGWAAMAWSILISAFGGWLVWGWVNQVRGVAKTAPLMYLMPPVAGLFAWALTGEQYTAIKLVGAAIALMGVAYTQFGPQRKNPS